MARGSQRSPAGDPTEGDFFEETPETQSAFDPYVEWVGDAGYREITAMQWEDAGIPDQDAIVWTRESPRVPLSQLTEAAQQRLAGEPHFQFVYAPLKEES